MQLLLMVMFRPSIASDEGWIPTLAVTKAQHPNSLLLEQQMPGFGADIIRYLSGDTIDPAPLRARNSEPQRTKITLDTSSDAADEEVNKRILEIFQTLLRASLLLSAKGGKCQDIVDLLMPLDPVDLNSYVSMMSNTDTPLHAAAANGHWKVAILLLERGAKVNLQGLQLGTTLHVAGLLWSRGSGDHAVSLGCRDEQHQQHPARDTSRTRCDDGPHALHAAPLNTWSRCKSF
jgi:ankyrin repeat protein